MKQRPLHPDELLKALTLLGERIGGYDDIEVLIVGGIAGKLAGLLGPGRTTTDCDIMVFDPENAFGQVEHEAYQVGKELGLQSHWLNGDSRGFAHYLPKGWKARRKRLGNFGLLHVFYISRIDFIALKVLAGRAVDDHDLIESAPTHAEAEIIREHLAALEAAGVIAGDQANKARLLLAAVEAKP